MVLNFIVIIVVHSTPKLRRNTYINLVLSLSETDFIFGLSTLLNCIRRLLGNIFGIGDLCFMSILLTSSVLIVSLYQTFLIGLHRFIVIAGSGLGRVLFKDKRKYIWYTNDWAIIIVPLSFYYYPLRIVTDCSFEEVTADNLYVIFCVIAIPECVYMVNSGVLLFSYM